jgi:hypothetical protein
MLFACRTSWDAQKHHVLHTAWFVKQAVAHEAVSADESILLLIRITISGQSSSEALPPPA